MNLVGMNDVQIETHEYKLYYKDVRQVKMNLVSIGQLGATGYTSTFKREVESLQWYYGSCTAIKTKLVLFI